VKEVQMTTLNTKNLFLNFSEAADLTGLDRRDISNRVKLDCEKFQGKPFPHDHFGTRTVIPALELEQYIKGEWTPSYVCNDPWHYKDKYKETVRPLRRVINKN
tara:strand:+ start:656 stop:964 length:309 start_codon:yes stop_codon:yes gene_type:complete